MACQEDQEKYADKGEPWETRQRPFYFYQKPASEEPSKKNFAFSHNIQPALTSQVGITPDHWKNCPGSSLQGDGNLDGPDTRRKEITWLGIMLLPFIFFGQAPVTFLIFSANSTRRQSLRAQPRPSKFFSTQY